MRLPNQWCGNGALTILFRIGPSVRRAGTDCTHASNFPRPHLRSKACAIKTTSQGAALSKDAELGKKWGQKDETGEGPAGKQFNHGWHGWHG
jgi:hypothetical protein